jgi:hypothetical protein
MSPMSNSDFAQFVQGLEDPSTTFSPTATYDPDGDCIEFLARPDSFYAERVDDLVTVYYSHDTDQIIGSLIKGVSRFCKGVLERIPGFKIEIEDGEVLLEHIFLAGLWSARHEHDDMVVVKYRKLIEVAEETKTKVLLEFCQN